MSWPSGRRRRHRHLCRVAAAPTSQEAEDPLLNQWKDFGLRTRFCPTLPSLQKQGFLADDAAVKELQAEIRDELAFLEQGSDAMLAAARASKTKL